MENQFLLDKFQKEKVANTQINLCYEDGKIITDFTYFPGGLS